MQHTSKQRAIYRYRLYLVVYCLGLVVLFVFGVYQTSPAGFPLGGPEDYTIFYTAGQVVGTGNASRLYDLSYQSQVQQDLLQPYVLSARGGLLPYNYPPFFALLFVPLARLSLSQSFVLWYGLSVGLVVLAVLLLLRELNLEWRKHLLLVFLMVISFQPILRGLAKGQSSAVMLILLTVTFLAWKHGRDSLAGATLALAMIKPQLALPIVLVLFLLRRWRSLLAFAVVSLSLLVISGLLVGTQGLSDYIVTLRYSAVWTGQPGFYPEVMPNIRGSIYRLSSLLEAWTTFRLPISLLAAITGMLSIVGFVALVRLWGLPVTNDVSSDLDLRLSATLMLALLLSPHVYDHDLALLVVAGFFIVSSFVARNETGVAWSIIAPVHLTSWLAFLVLSSVAYAQTLAFMLMITLAVSMVFLHRRNMVT